MGLVEAGKITLKEAGEKIGVSYRQAKRIRKAVKLRGAKGVIHGNTGRVASNKIAEAVRQRVLSLSRERYWDLNDTHFGEKLREREAIVLSRETIRKIRREAAVLPKRRWRDIQEQGWRGGRCPAQGRRHARYRFDESFFPEPGHLHCRPGARYRPGQGRGRKGRGRYPIGEITRPEDELAAPEASWL